MFTYMLLYIYVCYICCPYVTYITFHILIGYKVKWKQYCHTFLDAEYTCILFSIVHAAFCKNRHGHVLGTAFNRRYCITYLLLAVIGSYVSHLTGGCVYRIYC